MWELFGDVTSYIRQCLLKYFVQRLVRADWKVKLHLNGYSSSFVYDDTLSVLAVLN